jgi:hypothetical protein
MANVDPNTLLRNGKYYFVKRNSSKKFSETDIIKMLKFKKNPTYLLSLENVVFNR